MRDLIRKELLKRIVDGRYAPGTRLVEMRIAREFQTSQAPVREALRELEALRLVDTQPFKGSRVRGPSAREMAEAAVVRGLLEQAAAGSAAPRLAADASPLLEAAQKLAAAAKTRDLEEYARSNLRFHRLIVEAADNEVMLRVWDSLMLEARTLIGLSVMTLDLEAVAATHFPIVEAFQRGDAALAGRLLVEHAEFFKGMPETDEPPELHATNE